MIHKSCVRAIFCVLGLCHNKGIEAFLQIPFGLSKNTFWLTVHRNPTNSLLKKSILGSHLPFNHAPLVHGNQARS